jgi:hypothetical protein
MTRHVVPVARESLRSATALTSTLTLLDQGGSVSIVTAVSMMTLIYSAAMALDLANVFYIKSVDQRIADQSAIAAAFAYASSGSTVTMQKAASSLATANGAGGATVTASLVTSPSGDGHQAAYVTVTTAVPLSGFGYAATVSKNTPSGSNSFTVAASAYAEIHGATPCILAKQTHSTGLAATGGTKMTATSCDVGSNSGVTVSNGPSLTATAIYAVGSITASGGATITGTQYPNSSIMADPYLPSGDTSSPVFARLQTSFFTTPSSPVFPTVPSAPSGGSNQTCTGGTMTLAGNSSYGTVSAGANGGTCSLIKFSGGGTTSILNLSLPGNATNLSFGAGTYKIGGINIGCYSGSVTVTMTGKPSFYIYNGASSGIKDTASVPVTFNGTATWYIQGGITDSSTGSLTFTNTDSSSPSTFTVAGGISVSSGPATFPDGTYTLTAVSSGAALNANNGGTITMGNGSFIIADGISIGGGDKLTIGSALNASSVFEIPTVVTGNNAITTGGGSSLSIGSFSNVDINGEVEVQGSLTLGAGAYTVNGALDLAASGGGTVSGTGVSLIASGPIAFGQGFSAINLTAPSAITGSNDGDISTVALASSSGSASTISQGATNTDVTGAVYVPQGTLTINGAGNLTGGGNCLQVISAAIAMSGGGSLTTNCSSLGTGTGSGAVTLVD